MIRRNFLKGLSLLGAGSIVEAAAQPGHRKVTTDNNDRKYWIETLSRIASPVLTALSENRLTERMPVESAPGSLESRKKVTYLEALGRTLAGLAPWLELGADSIPEGKLRGQFVELSIRSIKNAVTPSSVNYMNFTEGGQP